MHYLGVSLIFNIKIFDNDCANGYQSIYQLHSETVPEVL